MTWFLLPILLLMWWRAIYYLDKSLEYLSPEGIEKMRIVFGVFFVPLKRMYYTETGWYYVQKSIKIILYACIVGTVFIIISSYFL